MRTTTHDGQYGALDIQLSVWLAVSLAHSLCGCLTSGTNQLEMSELNQLVEVQTEALTELEVRMDERSELREVRTAALDKAEAAVMRLEHEVDHLNTQLHNVKGQETAEVSNHS